MKKKWITAIIVYAALLTACIVVVYAVPSLRGMLEKTYVTEYGKIDIADEVSAYIVRDETVYVAAQDCEIKRVAETNKLLKAGTRAVEITPILNEETEAAKEAGPDASQEQAEAAAEANEEAPDNISRRYAKVMEDLGDNVRSTEKGYTRDSGYVSFCIDGAEAALSTDRLADLSRSDYEDLTKLRAIDTPDRKCGKGDPVFKVTSNSKWYLVFYIDNKAGEKYYEGRTVSVDISGKNVPVKVAQVQVGKETTKVTLSCKMFFEGFLEERRLDTTVTVASAEGLVLQDSSIVKKGEQIGVFVKNKLGEHKFKPISIKADDGERCVVFSDIYVDEGGNYVETVKTYDEIVAEPSEEEVAELQKQAKKEAAEKAKKEAEEKAKKEAEEKEAAAKAAMEAEKAKAAAEAKKQAEAAGTKTDAAGTTTEASGAAAEAAESQPAQGSESGEAASGEAAGTGGTDPQAGEG